METGYLSKFGFSSKKFDKPSKLYNRLTSFKERIRFKFLKLANRFMPKPTLDSHFKSSIYSFVMKGMRN